MGGARGREGGSAFWDQGPTWCKECKLGLKYASHHRAEEGSVFVCVGGHKQVCCIALYLIWPSAAERGDVLTDPAQNDKR